MTNKNNKSVEKKKKDYIPCTECLPISNLNGHKTYKGILIHSRVDCPPNTIYMINENDWKKLATKTYLKEKK